jgi:hypothetical protein
MRRAWRSGEGEEGVGQKPPRVHDYDDPGGRPGRGEDGPRRIGTGGICIGPRRGTPGGGGVAHTNLRGGVGKLRSDRGDRGDRGDEARA